MRHLYTYCAHKIDVKCVFNIVGPPKKISLHEYSIVISKMSKYYTTGQTVNNARLLREFYFL